MLAFLFLFAEVYEKVIFVSVAHPTFSVMALVIKLAHVSSNLFDPSLD